MIVPPIFGNYARFENGVALKLFGHSSISLEERRCLFSELNYSELMVIYFVIYLQVMKFTSATR